MFKNRLEKNAIKPLDIKHLPPIDKKKVCRQSLKSIQDTLDESAIKRAEILLAKSGSKEVSA